MNRIFLCTVGTSLLESEKQILAPAELERLKGLLKGGPDTAMQIQQNGLFTSPLNGAVDALKQRWDKLMALTRNRARQVQLQSAREALPAEACSLAALELNGEDVVVLIYSDSAEGAFAAACLQNLFAYSAHCGLTCDDAQAPDLIARGGVRRVAKLNAENPREFEMQGIPNLVNAILELKATVAEGTAIIMDVTGGYKPQSLYSSLVGLLADIDVRFLHQDAAGKAISLPRLPIHFDLLEWHEYEAILTLIPTLDAFQGEPHYVTLSSSLQPCLELKDACDESHHFSGRHYCWKPLGKAIQERTRKEYRIERHTSGRQLLALITDPALGKKLLERIERRHPYFWEGNKLPEAVDHGRAHTQNLLNLAAQVLVPLLAEKPTFLSPYELYLLINCFWLHDIGQAGGSVYLKKSVEGDWWGPSEDADAIELPLTNPNLVREAHNLLTYEQIRNDPKRFGFDTFDAEAKLIANICRYDRKSMPLVEADQPFSRNLYGYQVMIANPLAQTLPVGLPTSDQVRPRLVCALLRVIDVCDTQKTRAGEADFQRIRRPLTQQDQRTAARRTEELETVVQVLSEKVSGHELNLDDDCWKKKLANLQIKGCRTKDEKALRNALIAYWDASDAAALRSRQDEHFEKHDQIERVYITHHRTDGHHFVIHLELIKNPKEDKVKEAVQDITDDYKSAKCVLDDFDLTFDIMLDR